MFRGPHVPRVSAAASAMVVALMLSWAAVPAFAQAAAGALAAQSSVDRGVTVKVTPKVIGLAGTRWEFGVALDTHSANLSDDLMQSATLTTDDGRMFKPVGWTGSAPGGHHRDGVLVFDVPAPRPASIEVRILRPGETVPRSFRWQL